jgi:hypothetical protein
MALIGIATAATLPTLMMLAGEQRGARAEGESQMTKPKRSRISSAASKKS